MGKKDPRIDAYISRANPFARPILKHLRKLVHTACPDVEETVKWGMPHFSYHGNVCGMAAFKAHATFGFWKGSLLLKKHGPLGKVEEKAMGQFGRIASLADLPSDKRILAWVKEAAELNANGVKVPRKPGPRTRPEADVPDYFMQALRKDKAALAAFKAFSPSHRREYVEWITEARTEATRERRIATALEWIAAGRGRNWKYARK